MHVLGDRALIARSGGAADTKHVAELVGHKVDNIGSCGVLWVGFFCCCLHFSKFVLARTILQPCDDGSLTLNPFRYMSTKLHILAPFLRLK